MKNRLVAFGQRTAVAVLTAAVLLAGAVPTITAKAANYTYTLTFSSGNQGSFSSAEVISVDNTESGSSYEVTQVGEKLVVTGLAQGDIVSCRAQSAVELPDSTKYYVKGIRLSGRDNNTVAASAFLVNADQDYVVAYGIPGDLTQYTVNYIDKDGNALAESETYYGNVGDEPVIAYAYIDGYVPSTYNQTRALEADSAKNVFDFVYVPRDGANGEDDTTSSEGQVDDLINVPTDETNPDGAPGADGNATVADGEDADGSGGDGADADNGLGTNDNADELTQLDDGPVPLAQQAANLVKDASERGVLVPFLLGTVDAVALAVFAAFLILNKRKRCN